MVMAHYQHSLVVRVCSIVAVGLSTFLSIDILFNLLAMYQLEVSPQTVRKFFHDDKHPSRSNLPDSSRLQLVDDEGNIAYQDAERQFHTNHLKLDTKLKLYNHDEAKVYDLKVDQSAIHDPLEHQQSLNKDEHLPSFRLQLLDTSQLQSAEKQRMDVLDSAKVDQEQKELEYFHYPPYKSNIKRQQSTKSPSDYAWFKKGSTETVAQAFVRLVRTLAKPKGEIVLILFDHDDTVPIAINFYLTSIAGLDIKNYLFVTVDADDETCQDLREVYFINCFSYFDSGINALTIDEFTNLIVDMSANGDRKNIKGSSTDEVIENRLISEDNRVRTDIIYEALEASFKVLFTEVDVFFYQNPLDPSHCPIESCDMAALYDVSSIDKGFMYVNPTDESKLIYSIMKHFRESSKLTYQEQLYYLIKRQARHRDLLFYRLPLTNFQNGFYFYELAKRYFPKLETFCNECVVVRNTWIEGAAAKVYRAKELQQWVYDKNGYYSSTKTQYLLYDNSLTTAGVMRELAALQDALQIASILNRTLILPVFHVNEEEVPLNSLLSIADFDKYFEYRESGFLTHPLVPEHVRNNATYGVVILTEFIAMYQPSLFQDRSLKKIIPMNKTSGLGMEEIVKAFGLEKASVLVFHSMYSAFSGYISKDWEQKLKLGFVRATYRQGEKG